MVSPTEILASGTIIALRPDVIATVIDEGALLLDLDSKYFYALNESAWALVHLLEDGATPEAVRAYAQRAGAPDDGAVEALLEALCTYDLLEPGETAGELPEPPAGTWCAPTIARQAEPLQRVIVSAFDPSIPLAE